MNRRMFSALYVLSAVVIFGIGHRVRAQSQTQSTLQEVKNLQNAQIIRVKGGPDSIAQLAQRIVDLDAARRMRLQCRACS
jgi:hypothetical protein